MKTLAITREQFKQLPIEVQDEARSILKAYDEVAIVYEYGKYNVGTGICIKKEYAPDHNFIGIVYAEDIYTEDERMINYMESFHAYPMQYKGNRDYVMLHNVGYDWSVKFKFDENHNIVRA